MEPEEIRVGVSSCLLGEAVRYDGGHKRDAFVADVLASVVRLVPVCPEVGIGLGTPRETLQLLRRDGRVHLVATETRRDHTDAMDAYAHRKVAELAELGIAGYVLKRGSPSCGRDDVPWHGADGDGAAKGPGIFARILGERLPLLPVEDEARLADAARREHFVERVFAYHELGKLFRTSWTAPDVARFQARETLLLLAHDPAGCRALGRLAADVERTEPDELRAAYERRYMQAFGRAATRERHVNVLRSALGDFRGSPPDAEQRPLRDAIEDYAQGRVPLAVPVALIRDHARRLGVESLTGQRYLDLHAGELLSRERG
jgi:uncharacterized protein YbbK (DUF523 family)/uncharacterized protein YbgA (DUF1722 family)